MITHQPFTDLTTVRASGDGDYTATIDPVWTIGPKVHGGAMMALCAAAMPVEPPEDAIAVTADHPVGHVVHVAQGCDIRMDSATTGFLDGKQGPPVNRLWVRPLAADEADPATAALFAIMAGDISTPVTMNHGIFGWAPTVQLTTYLRRRPAPGWLRVVASSTVVGDSWFEEDHGIVDSTGNVVVQSRQLALLPKK